MAALLANLGCLSPHAIQCYIVCELMVPVQKSVFLKKGEKKPKPTNHETHTFPTHLKSYFLTNAVFSGFAL